MHAEPQSPWSTRPAEPGDVPALAAIYAHHVETGLGSFEEVPPSVDEMRRRFDTVRAGGLPWRVAEQGGAVVGYCYASPFRTRSGYRFTVENAVYVAAGQHGQGIGARLLQEVIDACTALGYRQMVAVIGDSANAGSLRLHAQLGFRTIGTIQRVGVKFGRWVDTVYMQRALGEEQARPPSADPLGYLPPGG